MASRGRDIFLNARRPAVSLPPTLPRLCPRSLSCSCLRYPESYKEERIKPGAVLNWSPGLKLLTGMRREGADEQGFLWWMSQGRVSGHLWRSHVGLGGTGRREKLGDVCHWTLMGQVTHTIPALAFWMPDGTHSG